MGLGMSAGGPVPVGAWTKEHIGPWIGVEGDREVGWGVGALEEAVTIWSFGGGPVVCVAGSPLPPPPELLPKTAYESLRPALYLSLWDALQYMEPVSAAAGGPGQGALPAAVREGEKTRAGSGNAQKEPEGTLGNTMGFRLCRLRGREEGAPPVADAERVV